MDVRHHMLLRHPGNDVAHVSRRRDREGGDGAAIGDREQHPAVKKRNQVAVGFAQVDVLSAGVGKHGAEFGKGDASAQRNHSPKDPHQEKQLRVRQRPGNILGGKKNRGADDAAYQQQYGVEQTKPTDETRFLRGGFGFGGREAGGVVMSSWLVFHPQIKSLVVSRWSFAVRRSLFADRTHRPCIWGLPTTNDRRLTTAYPIPNSSEDSSGVPQRRQMTDEQSPQVSGSLTSKAHTGQ